MGSILSRRIAGVEDIDIQANSAYRYPPKSGELPGARVGAGAGDTRRLGDWTSERPVLRRTVLLWPFLVPVESEAWLRPWLFQLATVAPYAAPS